MDIWISQLLENGPWVVFTLLLFSGIGIPLSEDLILVPAGMLVQHGDFPLWTTLLAAYFGVITADCLWFQVCANFGNRISHSRWFKKIIHPKRMLQVKYQFDVRGVWVIVLARFIPGSRTTAITVAGMMHMAFWQFLLASAVCCLFTVPMQIFAGWWIAASLQAESTVETIFRLIALVMVVVFVIWGYRLWSSHRASGGKTPRARARWLRKKSNKTK